METHPKLRRVPTIFGTSCSSHALSDVINKSVLLSRPFPSIRRPSTAPTDTSSPHEPTSPVTIADILNGRLCPSAAPPSTPPRNIHQKTQKRRSSKKVLEIPAGSDNEIRETEYEEDEEEETDAMFSSRSFSSDSSAGRSSRRRRTVAQPPRVEMKDSFAVMKKSSDPHGDFRRSMVEMIVEKEMFGEEDLEGLLQCFLSLNSPHHHGVIVEVFTEIWEAMFPHWS